MKLRKTALMAALLCLTLAACAAPESDPWEPPATTAPTVPTDPEDTEPTTVPTDPEDTEPPTVPTDPSEPTQPTEPEDPELPDLGPHIHRYGKWTVRKKATCLKEGTKVRFCNCGQEEVKSYEGEHSFSEWTVTLEPTCTEEGTESRTCSVCKLEETQAVQPLGHEEVVTPGVPATCTTAGISDHIECGRCGEVLQENHPIAPAHDVVTIPRKESGCGRIGQTEGSYCRACGEVLVASQIIPADEHTPVVTKGEAPTCTDYGMTDRISCSKCKSVLQMAEPIARLGHDLQDGVCTRCGHNCDHGVDPDDPNAKGASEEHVEHFQARTCSEYPYDVVQCSLCGEKSRLTTATAQELHGLFDLWSDLKIVTQPTPEYTGMMERECRFCGLTEQYAVMAVPKELENAFTDAGFGALMYHASETVCYLVRDLRPGGSSAVTFTALEDNCLQVSWTGPGGEEQTMVLEPSTQADMPLTVGQINPDGTGTVIYASVEE